MRARSLPNRFGPCLLFVACVSLGFSCGAQSRGGEDASTAPARDGAAPELLPRPFSAEQIRDEWVAGLEILWRKTRHDGESTERWRVLEADAEGALIEFVELDPAGDTTGEPQSYRPSWVELRDHASFAADQTKRERVERETPLGRLEGWLYTVADPQSGAVTEHFFALRYPGAPLSTRIIVDDDINLERVQVERRQSTGG